MSSQDCNIISAEHASINGSNGAYGGYITSASYTPSMINGYHRATVTLVGDSLDTPGSRDGLTLGIGDMNLNMQVGSYTMEERVGSMPTLTINLYDNSTQLDNSFVFLKEEVPEELGGIGEKYGPKPDKDLAENIGIITPASDTNFVKLRDFYKPLSEGEGGDWSFDLDAVIANAPGKTLYTASDLTEKFSDILGEEFDLDGGPFDFQGSLRDVLFQIASSQGKIIYWDPQEDTVKIGEISSSSSVDTEGCTVIATSSTEDFTTTRAQGAVGTFSSSNPGESQSSSGGNMARYFQAELLQPTLKIRKSLCDDSLIDLTLFDDDGQLDADIAKAVTAAQNPKVYAMYVLQSILGRNVPGMPDQEITIERKGQGNEGKGIETNLNDFIFVSNVFESYNKFLSDYYGCQEDGSDDPIFKVYPFEGTDDEEIDNAIDLLAENWNENLGDAPAKFAGLYNDGFTDGYTFIKKTNDIETSSIFGDNLTLTGDGDILRKLLLALGNFFNRMYVVKDTAGSRSVKTKAKDYGYYVTSNAAVGGQAPQPESGFRFISMDPFAPVGECGNSIILELATILGIIYAKKDSGCSIDALNDKAVVDFIYALENDRVQQFFRGTDTTSDTESTSASLDKGGQGYIMYLMVKEGSNINQDDFTPERLECFDPVKTFDHSIKGLAVTATEHICNVTLKQNGNLSKALDIDNYDVGVIGTALPVHDHVTAATFNNTAPRTIPLWFNVEGNSSSLSAGQGQAFIAYGQEPPGDSDTIWKSSMDFGISVNAADIARDLGIEQTYLADTDDEAFTYSRSNITTMKEVLEEKVDNSTWQDTETASSETATYLLTEDETPTIPSFEDGLDSLSIRSSNGKTEITVTVGNANIMRAKKTLRDLKSQNSHYQHQFNSYIASELNSAPNTRVQQIANGNLT